MSIRDNLNQFGDKFDIQKHVKSVEFDKEHTTLKVELSLMKHEAGWIYSLIPGAEKKDFDVIAAFQRPTK